MAQKTMCLSMRPLEILEEAKKALDLASTVGVADCKNFGEFFDLYVKDPKAKLRMGTALVVLSETKDQNLNILDHVRQVIRWRNEKGEPGDIEIQFTESGKKKRLEAMREKTVMDSWMEMLFAFSHQLKKGPR